MATEHELRALERIETLEGAVKLLCRGGVKNIARLDALEAAASRPHPPDDMTMEQLHARRDELDAAASADPRTAEESWAALNRLLTEHMSDDDAHVLIDPPRPDPSVRAPRTRFTRESARAASPGPVVMMCDLCSLSCNELTRFDGLTGYQFCDACVENLERALGVGE